MKQDIRDCVKKTPHIPIAVMRPSLYRLVGNVKNKDANRVRETAKQATREKVLEAAEQLAWESGPKNLSLDAVAARAGISKGGLLYHFPNKAKLLKALVGSFVQRFESELEARVESQSDATNSMARAYLNLFVKEHESNRRPPSGLLAAMAENPDFLEPIRKHHRTLLDRMKLTASDPTMVMIVFLALQGLRSMELLTMGTVTASESVEIVERLEEMLG